MVPPVACWPDSAAVTYHYDDLSVIYRKDPVTGVETPHHRVPSLGLNKIVLWIKQHPLLEVKVDSQCQVPLFERYESEKKGIAKYYLVGWKQPLGNGVFIHCSACYVPPSSAMPGRIMVRNGPIRTDLADHFFEPDFREAPVQCWMDSTTYTYHYQDGTRLDRINRSTGEEITSDLMPRAGLRKVTLWHHGLPVLESHYIPGQQSIFRRRNEYKDTIVSALSPMGIPMEGMLASTNWFAFKKAEAEGTYRALYMIGCKQRYNEREMQTVTYYYPQNGQIPPRVVLAGRFKEEGDSYLPIPVNLDDNVIT